MGIDDESNHPELCSEVADGVTRFLIVTWTEKQGAIFGDGASGYDRLLELHGPKTVLSCDRFHDLPALEMFLRPAGGHQ
jgi:hypothetical protein